MSADIELSLRSRMMLCSDEAGWYPSVFLRNETFPKAFAVPCLLSALKIYYMSFPYQEVALFVWQ